MALPATQLPAVECPAAALSDQRSDVAADRDDDAEAGLGCDSALADSACMAGSASAQLQQSNSSMTPDVSNHPCASCTVTGGCALCNDEAVHQSALCTGGG